MAQILGEPETARGAHVREGAVDHDGIARLHAAPAQHVRPHARERGKGRRIGIVTIDEVGIEVPGAGNAAGCKQLGLARIDNGQVRPAEPRMKRFRRPQRVKARLP